MSTGIRKQQILNLFNDCDVIIFVEEQTIRYYNKNEYWLGTYLLKSENFIYKKANFSRFFDESIESSEINELLRPIIEEIIKRKISLIYTPYRDINLL